MNELDKLFKDKLLDREFEFKDSHWQAAEQLIEQEERKRKRGGLWWRLGLFLLLFAIAGYFITKAPTTATVSASDLIEDGQNANAKAEYDPIVQDQVLSTAIQPNTNDQTNLNSSIPENQILVLSEVEVPKTESQTPVQSAISSYENNTSQNDSPNIGASLENAPVLDAQKVDIQLPALDTTAQQPSEKNKQKREMAERAFEAEHIFSTNEITTDKLDPLALKESELDLPEADCDDCFEFVKLNRQPKRISFGLVAEGLYYPKGTFQKSWIGTSLGGSLQLYLGKKIALRTGLQIAAMRYFGSVKEGASGSGSFSPLRDALDSENQYSFGLRTVNSFYDPKSLVQLEMPLLVQLRHRRHAIETGVQFSLLLGVRGTQYTESSLYPWEQDAFETTADMLITGNTGNEWISHNSFKKVTANLMLGYEYSISPRLALHLNSYFSLSRNSNPPLLKEGGFDNTGSSAESGLSENNGRFHFRAGAKWYFKH